MKLLMGVFLIRVIVALFENKTGKKNNKEQHDAEWQETQHPAEFRVR